MGMIVESYVTAAKLFQSSCHAVKFFELHPAKGLQWHYSFTMWVEELGDVNYDNMNEIPVHINQPEGVVQQTVMVRVDSLHDPSSLIACCGRWLADSPNCNAHRVTANIAATPTSLLTKRSTLITSLCLWQLGTQEDRRWGTIANISGSMMPIWRDIKFLG